MVCHEYARRVIDVGRVLDVGAGTGRIAETEAPVAAVEPSLAMLAIFEENPVDRPAFADRISRH